MPSKVKTTRSNCHGHEFGTAASPLTILVVICGLIAGQPHSHGSARTVDNWFSSLLVGLPIVNRSAILAVNARTIIVAIINPKIAIFVEIGVAILDGLYFSGLTIIVFGKKTNVMYFLQEI